RTAIARALSTDPEIIMADEPTGNLDHETSGEITELLMRLAHERDKCVIVVTHDLSIAGKSDVILQLDTKKKAFTIYN
ncbi:MAG: ABC transporter ATP-binding protein, partial [Erysipelotrichaceae bacterium]|nr:ABC transporter ATP-binding protein [Erysipelotrichaceae bacterium]